MDSRLEGRTGGRLDVPVPFRRREAASFTAAVVLSCCHFSVSVDVSQQLVVRCLDKIENQNRCERFGMRIRISASEAFGFGENKQRKANGSTKTGDVAVLCQQMNRRG